MCRFWSRGEGQVEADLEALVRVTDKPEYAIVVVLMLVAAFSDHLQATADSHVVVEHAACSFVLRRRWW